MHIIDIIDNIVIVICMLLQYYMGYRSGCKARMEEIKFKARMEARQEIFEMMRHNNQS